MAAALLPCEETEIARRERRAFLIMLASMEAGRLVSLALTSHIPWSLFLPTAASPLSFYFIPPATLLQLTAGETTVPAAPAPSAGAKCGRAFSGARAPPLE